MANSQEVQSGLSDRENSEKKRGESDQTGYIRGEVTDMNRVAEYRLI